MDNTEIKEILETLDFQDFKEQIVYSKEHIQESLDEYSLCTEQMQELLEALSRLETSLQNKTCAADLSPENDQAIFDDLHLYFAYLDAEEWEADSTALELEDIDIEEFKKDLCGIKNALVELKGSASEESEINEQIELIEQLQERFSSIDSLDELSEEEIEDLRVDFHAFLEMSENWLYFSDQFGGEEENTDAEVNEELDDEDYDYAVELEEIDLPSFKNELAELKGCFSELKQEFLQREEEIDSEALDAELEVIERLQKFFAKGNSLEDFNEQEIEAIRPDFDRYIMFSDFLFEALNSFADEEDDELEDECSEYEDEESSL